MDNREPKNQTKMSNGRMEEQHTTNAMEEELTKSTGKRVEKQSARKKGPGNTRARERTKTKVMKA